MKRTIALMGALGFACVISLSAQDSKVTTTTKTEGGAKMMTYAGCLGPGTETRTYMLNKVVPVTTTTETRTPSASSSTSETKYVLVPDEKVEVQSHLGQKVEVTGILLPKGESRVKTETKVDNEDAKDTNTSTTLKSDNSIPQFKVTSIKSTGETCS